SKEQLNGGDKAFALGALGVLAGIETDYARCRQLCEAAQALIQDDLIATIVVHLGLAIAYCGFEDYCGAKHHIRLALRHSMPLRITAFNLLCLPVIGIIYAFEDQPEMGVELMGLAF